MPRLLPLPLRLGAPVAVLSLALAAAFVLAACGDGEQLAATTTTTASSPRAAVVATTTQVGDLVRAIGGEAADVTQLLGPNTDPHDYEPRPSDLAAVMDAEIVFASGDGLDAWVAEIVEDAASDARTVTLGDASVTRLPGEDREHHDEPDSEHHAGDEHDEAEAHDTASGHDHEPSEHDPHWWHDPRNVAAAIPVVRDTLTAANPAARETYAANAVAHLRRVRLLDAGIERCFDAVPAAQRKLVTDHDAFGYFARRYDIHVVGAILPSLTTQAQPSAGDLADLAQTIRRERVRAIFPEESLSPRLAQAIARDTGASAERTLYGDALGPAGSRGATYLTMMEANADAMVRGFTDGRRGCTISGID